MITLNQGSSLDLKNGGQHTVFYKCGDTQRPTMVGPKRGRKFCNLNMKDRQKMAYKLIKIVVYFLFKGENTFWLK